MSAIAAGFQQHARRGQPRLLPWRDIRKPRHHYWHQKVRLEQILTYMMSHGIRTYATYVFDQCDPVSTKFVSYSSVICRNTLT